eukprot:SAG22_NODE_3035_length_2008_cov_2.006810_1_plen_191_part_00
MQQLGRSVPAAAAAAVAAAACAVAGDYAGVSVPNVPGDAHALTRVHRRQLAGRADASGRVPTRLAAVVSAICVRRRRRWRTAPALDHLRVEANSVEVREPARRLGVDRADELGVSAHLPPRHPRQRADWRAAGSRVAARLARCEHCNILCPGRKPGTAPAAPRRRRATALVPGPSRRLRSLCTASESMLP